MRKIFISGFVKRIYFKNIRLFLCFLPFIIKAGGPSFAFDCCKTAFKRVVIKED